MKKKHNPRVRGVRRKGSTYFVNIQVDGRRKEVRAGTDLNEAIALRSRLKLMANSGELQALLRREQQEQPRSITYRDAVEEHSQQHLKFLPSGRDMYSRLAASVRLFGSQPVSTLRWQEIESFRNQRLGEVAPSTVKQELDLMHAVLKRQVRNDVIAKNPLDFVTRPRVDNTREQIMTHKELLMLLDVEWTVRKRNYEITKRLENHTRLALVIGDYTAMRISEVLGIKWVHIRGDYEQFFVPKAKNRKQRHVPIHPELARILRSLPREGEYVVNLRGKRVKSIRKGFINAREKAGLPWVWIHDLRHRAITRWVQMGHSTSAIMKATGHRTFSAFQRYANLKEGDIMVLVGRKTEPLPVVTCAEFLALQSKNVEKVWKAA